MTQAREADWKAATQSKNKNKMVLGTSKEVKHDVAS